MTAMAHIRAWGAVAVFAVVVAVFAVNARNELVRFDDLEYIAQNPHVRNGLTPRSVAWALSNVGYAANWHPLTWMSHAFDVSLARALKIDYAEEPNPIGMWARVDSPFARFVHIENIAWHAANAVLLYLVILLLTEGVSREARGVFASVAVAALCTLFWAVHPLRVEVVAWASERKELLSVFFALASLLLYLRQGSSTSSVVCYALSLLAKPVAVGFPAVLVGIDILREGKCRREAFGRALPYVLLASGTCLLTLLAQRGAMSQGAAFGLKTRMGMVLSAPAVYLQQTVWPSGLSADYAMLTSSDWPVVVAGGLVHLAVLVIAGLWIRAALRGRAASFAWRLAPLLLAWCYVSLIPMLGVVKVGYQPHSDRYTYWVGCGLSAILALALRRTESQWREMAGVFAFLSVALTAVLGGLSVAQSAVWRNNVALMSDMVGKSRSPFMAQVLASELVIRGQSARAGEMLRKVVSENPCAYAYGALAWHEARLGNNGEAHEWANRALEANPRCSFALGAMGLVAKNRGDYPRAVEFLEKSLAENSDYELTTALEECRGKAGGECGRDKGQ